MSCQQLHGRVGGDIRHQFPAPRFIGAINYAGLDNFLNNTCRNPNNNSNMDRIIKASICKSSILLDILNKSYFLNYFRHPFLHFSR